MDSSKGRNVLSGSRSEEDCYIAPAVYVDVDNDDPLMQDEIFGPVLPIVTVDNMEEAIYQQEVSETVLRIEACTCVLCQNREKPLAFYLFTESKKTFEMVANRTSSGALCHNDTIMYAGC